MLMYVHYYDRYEKLPEENPTVGILLCKEKDDALVEITLPEDANIYASEYQLYLPDKKELQKKLKEWIEEGTDLQRGGFGCLCVLGYKLATKILKTQRKSIFSENMITVKPENMPLVTQGSPNLIREGGRTVGSGRVATIIE